MALKLKKYPKRSPYWVIRGTINGVKIFESTETVKRDEAEACLRKRSPEIYNAAKLNEQPPATFGDAVTVYLEGGGDPRFLDPLMDEFEVTAIRDISQVEMNKLIKKLYPAGEPKATTVNRNVISPYISVVRAGIRATLPHIPPIAIKRRKETKVTATPASDDHIEKLLPHCSLGLQALLQLMTYTGLRTGEALRVTEEDIKDGYIHVGKTKNGEARMVPTPDGFQWPPGGFGFSTTQGVGIAFRRASKAAGLPYRDGHELGRHAFAARWLRAGHSLKDLKEAGGWKTLKVVDEIYGHLEQSRLHDTMRELSKNKRAQRVQKNTEDSENDSK